MAFFCVSFFLAPKIGALFLFLKGVARQGRALEGHGCNGECSHSQRHPFIPASGALHLHLS